jgi:hypothetical protein
MEGAANVNDKYAEAYRVITMKAVEYEDGYTQWEEAKTIGYLSAYKCFVRGLDNPFEILAYIA